jgi:hypothetical protein
MVNAGTQSFIAFGPNRWFPFEIGHLNAPLAGTLPKPLAAYVTYAWLKLVRQPRELRRIREILDGMTYVSSRAFRKECRRIGITAENAFARFVGAVAADDAAPVTGSRRLIKTWPRVTRVMAQLVAATGFEPQVYFFLTHINSKGGPTSDHGSPLNSTSLAGHTAADSGAQPAEVAGPAR